MPDSGGLILESARQIEAIVTRLTEALADAYRDNKILRAEIEMLRAQISAMTNQRDE